MIGKVKKIYGYDVKRMEFMGKKWGSNGKRWEMPRALRSLFWVCSFLEEGLSRDEKVTDEKRKRPCEVPMTILHKVLIYNFLVGFQGMVQGCEKVSFLTIFRMPSFVP